jgi:hypothetical protein
MRKRWKRVPFSSEETKKCKKSQHSREKEVSRNTRGLTAA